MNDNDDTIIALCTVRHTANEIINETLSVQTPVHLGIRKTSNTLNEEHHTIETVSPEGTFCDTLQVPSGAGDMQPIQIRD